MNLQARVEALEERVESLEKERSGRKTLPILVSEPGICGVDPESDATTCPHGSLYRRRKGCLGDACVLAATEYYEQYRANHAVASKGRRR